MKQIIVCFLDRSLSRILNEDIQVNVRKNGDFLDVLAGLDNIYLRKPFKAKRGNTIVKSIMQLVWDARNGKIYEDIGIESRDPENNWIPILNDPYLAIPNETRILITPDPGC